MKTLHHLEFHEDELTDIFAVIRAGIKESRGVAHKTLKMLARWCDYKEADREEVQDSHVKEAHDHINLYMTEFPKLAQDFLTDEYSIDQRIHSILYRKSV